MLTGILQYISNGKAHVLFSTPGTSIISMPYLHCLLCISSLWKTKQQNYAYNSNIPVLMSYKHTIFTKYTFINITYIYHCSSKSHKNITFYELLTSDRNITSMLRLQRLCRVNTVLSHPKPLLSFGTWYSSFDCLPSVALAGRRMFRVSLVYTASGPHRMNLEILKYETLISRLHTSVNTCWITRSIHILGEVSA